MKKLPKKFYNRPTIKVAVDLLGCKLISNIGGIKTGGIIVETEAYIGETDPACHAFRGRTKRTEVMYGLAGSLYVYFTYGNHFMMNVVTEKNGFPAAVLLRGLEPLYNIENMRERRGITEDSNISSGPGKMTKSLGIIKEHNGTALSGSKIYIIGPPASRKEIYASPRIGIGEGGSEKLWRFYFNGNQHVSKGARYNGENSFSLSKAKKMEFRLS